MTLSWLERETIVKNSPLFIFHARGFAGLGPWIVVDAEHDVVAAKQLPEWKAAEDFVIGEMARRAADG